MTAPRFPVSELIAQTVQARLALLKTVNGYQLDVADVVRPTVAGGYSPTDRLAVLEQADAERESEHDYEGNPNRIAWGLHFEITLLRNQAKNDPTPEDQLVNTFEAEAIKALTAPDRWEHFGESGTDLAYDAAFKSPKRIVSTDGAYCGTEINFVVYYRHPENDPYTVG